MARATATKGICCLTVALVSCGSPRGAPLESLFLPKAAEQVAVPGPITAPLPRRMLKIEPVVCSWETRAIYQSEPSEKLLLSDEDGYLEVDATQSEAMRLSTSVGAPPPSLLEVRYRGTILRGHVDVSLFIAHPRSHTIFGGMFRATEVSIAAGTAASIVISGDPGSTIHPIDLPSLEVECDKISFTREDDPSAEEIAKALGAKGDETGVRLAPGSVNLHSRPGGPVVATIDANDETYVSAYQSEGAHRFIMMWTEHGQVFGWVRGRDLLPAPPIGSMFGTSGQGRGFAAIPTDWRGRRCASDVPIFLKTERELVEVGAVSNGTVFSVEEDLGRDLARFVLRHRRFSDGRDPPEIRVPEHVRLVNGATLVVERRRLNECEREVLGEAR